MDMALDFPSQDLQGLGPWLCSFKSKGSIAYHMAKTQEEKESVTKWDPTEESFKGEEEYGDF